MQKPSIHEITEHLIEKKYDDFTAQGFAAQFWNYYESNGWKVGRNSMKNWKAAIVTWELKNSKNAKGINGHNNKPGRSERNDQARANY